MLDLKKFYLQHKQRLGFNWLSPVPAPQQYMIGQHIKDASLIGHLNLIYPNCIQILGNTELSYLQGLGKNSYQDTLYTLFAHHPSLIILSEQQSPPYLLLELAQKNNTPVWQSHLASANLINYLQYYLSSLINERKTFHGVFMEVMGIGVLLTGESGIGKSEVALELINMGHRLIADDAPEFFLSAPDTLHGICPELLRDFLEVRGLGILNIRAMFGDSAIRSEKKLSLILHLEEMTDNAMQQIDRLQGNQCLRSLLDVNIIEITLPVTPGRDMAILVEAAVRNHVLHLKGYNAAKDFKKRQRERINQTQETIE